MYCFDDVISRWNTSSTKWDGAAAEYQLKDILPMWVADMDFACPNPVIEAVRKRAEHPVYGYSFPPEECLEAITDKLERENGWKIQKEWIVFTHGVVDGLNSAVRAVTKPGDRVMVQPPVYYPFYHVIRHNQCELVKNPLVIRDGKYVMDFEGMEECLKTGVKAFILCSPHNPVGRVWTKAELERVLELCAAYDCTLLSDEIHCDLVYEPYVHTATAGLETSGKCISFYAASKTYNVPGLTTAFAVIEDEKMRKEFLNARMGHHGGNLFGYEAITAAYGKSQDYRYELLNYLRGNIEYFASYVRKEFPLVKVYETEGTYLIWADFRGYQCSEEELNRGFVEKCGLILDKGSMFGQEGEGFFRFNLACPRSFVKQALDLMKEFLADKAV
ncbi:MAG: MalY/PatB family protein [Eubacteriales bacterium]|nr:MalY/PatB family protein [Eubacteriales bacterium]